MSAIVGVLVNYCYFPSFDPYRSNSRYASQTSGDLLIRVAHLGDINDLAEILTRSFHPPEGLTAWFYPLLKLGISEDLRNRIRFRTLHEVCLVASKTVADGKREQIVGTVELAMRSHGAPFAFAVPLGKRASSFWSSFDLQHPYISNLAVSSSHRRQGIARKLLLKCEQIALQWGFKELSLHVLENNTEAKRLYFAEGYRVHRIESSLNSCIWKSPRRLFLNKQICIKII
jgi:ribosomal protein S18 acetylase RimI-like enzyme